MFFVGYFLDDDHPKIFKAVAWTPKMLVNSNGSFFFSIISVVIDAAICFLRWSVGLVNTEEDNLFPEIETLQSRKLTLSLES